MVDLAEDLNLSVLRDCCSKAAREESGYIVFVEDDGMLYFYHLSRLWGPLNPDRNSESFKNTRIDLSALDGEVDFEKLDDEFDLNSKENSISPDDVDSVFIKGLTLDSKDEFIGFDSYDFDSILNQKDEINYLYY